MVNPSRSEDLEALSLTASDHFERLGVPRRYAVDREAFEQAYRERAQRVHPDRFAGGSSGQQRAAMEASAALNEAYRVLRDPVRRAEYLCQLAGIDVDSNDPRAGAPAMGQEFLIEMIERREAVEEARASGPAALDALRGEVDDELELALDTATAALAADDPQAAARALVKRRYLQRLLDEIDGDV